jgi:carboxyl-terminal processing protease
MQKIFNPLFVAIAAICGILAGSIITERHNERITRTHKKLDNKIDMMLNLVNLQYVDKVDIDSLVEKSLPKILEELDPHTVYVPAKDLQMVNDELEGSFSGIGVQFNIQNDTVMIVSVISGGPSEKLGILPGDRIVKVNDTLFVGETINNEKVMHKLRGPKGTHVTLGIKRHSADSLLTFDITRGDVPVNSVDAHFMMQNHIGYIKVGKFGANTYNEFLYALEGLKEKGANKFIIDLRGNSGGLLDAACYMINEFLHRGDMIVYTEGKAQKRQDIKADGNGLYQNYPITVLIDEWSASASEIFAGAMQDNDRGTIIGRRSFGKGLVQQQITLNDSSAIRLTVARYYTPSGRCIQKPYRDKNKYQQEVFDRYSSGEIYNQDSMKSTSDTVKYYTVGNRVVYGGGGIMPDIFVPYDTTYNSVYYTKLVNSSILYDFAFKYSDEHRQLFNSFESYKKADEYLKREPLFDQVLEFAEAKNIKKNLLQAEHSKSKITQLVRSYILRNIYGENAFYDVFYEDDPVVKEALNMLKKDSK